MATGTRYSEYPRVDLIEIEPPGRQTEITWNAIKEGLREIFWSDIDGDGTPAIVILPDRVQATFVCRECTKSVVVKYYTADAIRGHITITRRCECGSDMYRRFLGADKDVPVEMDIKANIPEGLEIYFDEDEEEIDDDILEDDV